MTTKSAQRQFLVKVHGFPGYFMTKTGGAITSETTKVFDGGEDQPDVMAGPAEVGNITVTRTYDYERDDEIIRAWKKKVGVKQVDITITPLRRDMTARARHTDYPNALLVGLTEPDVDSNSGEPANFELEFAIGKYT